MDQMLGLLQLLETGNFFTVKLQFNLYQVATLREMNSGLLKGDFDYWLPNRGGRLTGGCLERVAVGLY